MAVRIEDAGFEIRDMIAWVYGSGFPKSLNIGKAVDKLQGNEREVTGSRVTKDIRRSVAKDIEAGKTDRQGKFAPGSPTQYMEHLETKGSSPYEGWGTALKPALEPITVARKPISEKNIAQNVLKWGTGGVNIDGSRVATELDFKSIPAGPRGGATFGKGGDWKRQTETVQVAGRFPANFIHDGSDEVLGLLGEQARFFYCAKAGKAERNKGLEGFDTRNVNDGRTTSIDNAFQRGDTPRANVHPTVKPIKLMQYLVKLVTPTGGTVLDPFNGSGTTGIACKLEGFDYIGIELEAEYVEISNARIAAHGIQQLPPEKPEPGVPPVTLEAITKPTQGSLF
jgi:site-specific DNA-methyltransferase (adenine-specific)